MKNEKLGKMLVTPEMAKEWLMHNTHNRPVSRTTVEKYARDMKAGKWFYTNQGIGFDTTGTLTYNPPGCSLNFHPSFIMP